MTSGGGGKAMLPVRETNLPDRAGRMADQVVTSYRALTG
jgi:hypothetical protein